METKDEWPGDMPEEEFRRFASQISEWIADYFNKIEDLPVLSQVSPGWLKEQISPAALTAVKISLQFWRIWIN